MSETRTPRIAVNPPVFFTSVTLLAVFLAFSVLFRERAKLLFDVILAAVSTYFGWLYVLAVGFFILFTLWLLLSRHSRIRLGDDDERPEFGRPAWFAMLFSAGMGIGLVFYGVAEPMQVYDRLGPESALPVTFFHWGIHAWAIYVLMALSIAYFSFRRKLPLAIRSCFYPLLGDRIYGPAGHVIDIVAVFGTIFGLATSLGLGAKQIAAGLHHLFGLPPGMTTQLTVIGVVTGVATISLVTGVKKGIRRLSELNMTLAALLMLFVFAAGPTLFLLEALVENLGNYVGEVFDRTFHVGVLAEALGQEGDAWLNSQTLFYWGWWIAWAPFVGMFIARISRGRTIREFILGVLLVPTGVTFMWLTVFGGTALSLELEGAGIAAAVRDDLDTAIYVMLEEIPFSKITSALAAAVVAVFFVTSSDSASFVVDMLTSSGVQSPPVWQRCFWAVAEGACAAVLLYAGGDMALEALQSAVVSIGLPFCLLLIAMAFSLARALKDEERPTSAPMARISKR